MSPDVSDMAERTAQAKLAWFSLLDSRIPPEGHGSSGCNAPELDVELQVLDELVLSARRRRNAHVAWPCKLPFEVLAMILAQVKGVWSTRMTYLSEVEKQDIENEYDNNDWRKVLKENYDARRDLGWLNVTYVCNRFRKVLLSSSRAYLFYVLMCNIGCTRFTIPLE